MIRNRIVVGLLDDGLSEKMQLDPNLTLERAVSMARQSEAVHKQQGIVRGTSLKSGELESENMEAVNSRQGDKIKSATQKHIPPGKTTAARQPTKSQRTQNKCPRCGKTPWHNRQQCPAKDAQCHKCQKTGHYSACCYSRQISSVTETTNNTFLGAIESGSSDKQWLTTIMLNKTKVTFKLDTGAEATAISAETYQRLGKVSLQEPTKILRGAANSHLSVIGQFTGSLVYKQTNCLQEIFVVKGLQNNLLGLPAIKALSLIQRLQAVFLSERSIKQSFPNLFTGLGTLGKEYTIKLKQGATPYALHTAHRVPIPLRKKVEEELLRMQATGIISPVDDPSPWCAGMVVVPKPSGAVRICVDLTHLNQNVLREYHPLPNIDDTLAQLTGARKFTKLDANSGFWQIPLAKTSRLLTTFITPVGRFCFNKLPFGISCAPELFQKRMSTMLEGLQGVLCLMDDVLVYGQDQEDHDKKLEAVLLRIQSAGVTLNPDKC